MGMLSEQEMCKAYLECNVFICPSSIENSPNSLGEAQLLGIPHIASYVGGIPEIVNYNPEILYRFEESEMLASKVIDIFKLGDKFKPYFFDYKRYDRLINLSSLNKIYTIIANQTNRNHV